MLASPPDWLCALSVLASPQDWLCAEMVLPVRIELTTSALPRMRSTTELRQHVFPEVRAYEGGPRARQPGLKSRDCGGIASAMTGKDDQRDKRLAAALRENLRRRKAQERAQSAGAPDDKDS